MGKLHIHTLQQAQFDHLHIHCENCSGLCCTALFFSKIDGFPMDKAAETPCLHLQRDFRCKIHDDLCKRHMKGCLSYDCFGAGQLATQLYKHTTWLSDPQAAKVIFDTFLTLYQLQNIAWYIMEASTLALPLQYQTQLQKYQQEYEALRLHAQQLTPNMIDVYRNNVNKLLKQIIHYIQKRYPRNPKQQKQYIGKHMNGQDLRGMDFVMSLCIATNFEGCQLDGACFLGADLRDANICNTDLSNVLFLTQSQVNSMKGNKHTKLNPMLHIPSHWMQ